MKRLLLTGALVIAACGALSAQNQTPTTPNTTFDAAQIKSEIAYLASDELRGRGSGEPGNEKAAQYVAQAFQRRGFKPLGKGNEEMKSRKLVSCATALVGGLLFLAQSGSALKATADTTHQSAGILQPFRYQDVTLTGGPMGVQAQGARDFYLALSEDNLLNGFRKRAGLPAPGKPMGGWYDPDGFAGAHPFGQYVSALARMYANTGDVRYKEKVARLVHGFHETLAPDGYFYSSEKVFKEWPNYLYDKNCIGMRDAYTLTGNEEALVVLKKMTDWAVKNLPRRRDEWYTLPENLYNCYALTKDPRYLQMAKEYDYSKEYYDPFANGINAFTPERHAYSHVNTLASAAKAYEVTGDEKYFKAIENAWKFLTTTQMYASGGWGPRERFVTPGQGKLAASLESIDAHFETPCGAYANVNLDRYLLRFTGDPKYGDNMERVLYNGMLATLPMQPDGKTFYYSDYRSGTKKAYFRAAWPCCSGTYAQITADYPLDIYFHDARRPLRQSLYPFAGSLAAGETQASRLSRRPPTRRRRLPP